MDRTHARSIQQGRKGTAGKYHEGRRRLSAGLLVNGACGVIASLDEKQLSVLGTTKRKSHRGAGSRPHDYATIVVLNLLSRWGRFCTYADYFACHAPQNAERMA